MQEMWQFVKHLVHGEACSSEAGICIFWKFKQKADSGMKQVSFTFLLNINTVIYKGHLSLKYREGSSLCRCL